MNSSQFNNHQLEFGFAQTVTGKLRRKSSTRKSAAQRRAEKLAQTAEVAETRALNTPLNASAGDSNQLAGRIDWTEAPGVLGDEWIKGTCANIRRTGDLREAVTLAACYLTDMIDREIDMQGHHEAWKREYEAYCWTQYFSLTVEEEPALEELRALWWGAAIVLNADNGSIDQTDWEMFEDLCTFETDSGDLDENRAEASYIEFLALVLANLHGHLFRASNGDFQRRNRVSKS